MTKSPSEELSLDDLLEPSAPFVPTEEQQAILDASKSGNSLMIQAMAGCSKSTVLELIARASPKVPTLYVVFNKKNKIEAEKKFFDRDSKLASFGNADHVTISTLNGLGHGAWQRTVGKRLTLNTSKIGDITKNLLKLHKLDLTKDDFVNLMTIVSRARINGLVPKSYPSIRGLLPDENSSWDDLFPEEELSENFIFLARNILTESIKQAYAGLIDFDDQIYMSALFGGLFQRYSSVLVDESQDLSPLNHLQVKRSSAGKLTIVGDVRQAIYAWRGADALSMESLRDLKPSWIDLPLSTTFRCPKAVVSRQQAHAPGFNAHSSNKEGQFIDLLTKKWSVPDGKVAILCRNNAPLFAAALRLIKKGIGCTVLGRDIGKSLANLAKKVVTNPNATAEEALEKISAYISKEISKATLMGKTERVGFLSDKLECFEAIFGEVDTLSAALRAMERMFSEDNLNITLSTGHRAKGLEWPTVIHLDPWRIPSKYAKKSYEEGNSIPLEQDNNLRYVIETRSQDTLILANLEDFLND